MGVIYSFLVYLPEGIIYDTIFCCEMTNEELIRIVKERKEILSMNQEDLAALSTVGIATLKRFESGKGNITLNNLQKIVGTLGLEIRLVPMNEGK